MPASASTATLAPGQCSPRLVAFEVAWIFLLFFLAAGSLPPDVGESHYLVKAKHYWQPTWCAGDLFLESQDAHATFNWTFGWVTKFCSLTATAWIGRIITWLLLAWSWRRLSWAIMPRPFMSLLSAGFMLLLMHNFHLAGEWIVGGVEAKGFAYVLIFLALEAVAKNQWHRALLLAGAAGAFHVLVGGWTAVAIGLAWLYPAGDRPSLKSLLPAAAGGLVLALPGLLPALALNGGVPKDLAREAARIYVFERLSHHLVYHQFPAWFISRFQMLLVAWAALAWLLRKESSVGRIERVVAGTIVIALVGVLIDQAFVQMLNRGHKTTLEAELAVAPLLRYYWFRMSDSLVPIGVSLAIVAGLAKLRASRPALAAWLTLAAILLTAANLGAIYYSRSRQLVPPAILQPQPTADSMQPAAWWTRQRPSTGETTAEDWYRDWKLACQWVAKETPTDALFLTPREQQTFKWYAGRAEIVNWKDVPQDARGLVEWKQRLGEIYPREHAHHLHGLAAFSDADLALLAHKYNARYIVIDRTRSQRRIGLPRLYPALREDNPSFEIYRVPPPTKP